MSLWDWWSKRAATPDPARVARSQPGPVAFRSEPYVFECRMCHKVFERRRLKPSCTECGSDDVELLG